MRTLAVLLLATFTAAAQAPNQNWETVKSLTTGTEVRIAISSRTVRGDLIRATDDALVVASGKGQEMFTQPEVTRVSIGKTGHRGRNALIGLGVGAGVGAGIGAADDAHCRANNGFLCGLALPVLGILGGAIGTIVGVVWPTGGWREVYRK